MCVFEDPPAGFPIGANVSERVVFNGYFLKLMKYQAGDTTRGAPLLVGRIGWQPSEPRSRRTQRQFAVALDAHHPGRDVLCLAGALDLSASPLLDPHDFRSLLSAAKPPNEEIDPVRLDAWVRSVGPEEPHGSDHNADDEA